ncbi:hypothetical protein D3C86_2176920 [compost metagenome]
MIRAREVPDFFASFVMVSPWVSVFFIIWEVILKRSSHSIEVLGGRFSAIARSRGFFETIFFAISSPVIL